MVTTCGVEGTQHHNAFYEKIVENGKETITDITDEIPFDIPPNWAWCRLGSVCSIINGFTPNRNNSLFWDNGTIPWFTIQDIRNNGRYIFQTEQKISSHALSKNSVRLAPPKSLLLCCTASVGEYAISEISLTTNQQFNAITVKDEYKCILDPYYLFRIAPIFKKVLKEMAGATTFEFISVKKVESIMIPLPPLEEQKRIVDFITRANEQLDSMLNK